LRGQVLEQADRFSQEVTVHHRDKPVFFLSWLGLQPNLVGSSLRIFKVAFPIIVIAENHLPLIAATHGMI